MQNIMCHRVAKRSFTGIEFKFLLLHDRLASIYIRLNLSIDVGGKWWLHDYLDVSQCNDFDRNSKSSLRFLNESLSIALRKIATTPIYFQSRILRSSIKQAITFGVYSSVVYLNEGHVMWDTDAHTQTNIRIHTYA